MEGGENDEMLVEVYRFPVIRQKGSGDLIYSIETIVNNPELCT